MSPSALPASCPEPSRERIALFQLGARGFGVAAAYCREFFVPASVTRVPLAPPHLLGLGQLRGRIIPLIDIRPLLGVPAPPLPVPGHALLIAAAQLEAAVLVEMVDGFELCSVAPPLDHCLPELWSGVCMFQGEERPVLNAPALLASLRLPRENRQLSLGARDDP